ncbi:hypothetical protein DXG01_001403 [Tephrocybe rancida]|nr:hypothetical protein DXG01_001403 [Tephrocybe rancida]
MDVIRCLPELPGQNPQCEGVNQSRILFTSKVCDLHCVMYSIQQAPDSIPTDGQIKYQLDAGKAHGVTKHTEFNIYSDKHRSTTIGSVVVTSIAPLESYCTPLTTLPNPLPKPAYAVRAGIGDGQDISLFIEPKDALYEMLCHESEKPKRHFRLVKSPEQAVLIIRTQEGQVEFEVMDLICCEHGLECMPLNNVQTNDPDHLFAILRAAADFYWYLCHSNKQGSLAQWVQLQCFELVDSGTTDDSGNIVFQKSGQILITDGAFELKAQAKDALPSDYETVYGYKVTNNSKVPLYVALFYFDPSKLSIVKYYLPPTATNNKVDFCLPASGCLTIGYGEGGWPPRKYTLCQNQTTDVSFLKLYVSTKYIDYSSIEQKTLFERSRNDERVDTRRKRDLWDACTFPIIQRKEC